MLKKILIILIILVSLGIVGLCAIIIADYNISKEQASKKEYKRVHISDHNKGGYEIDAFEEEYEIYVNDSLIASFDNYDDAYKKCIATKNSILKKKGSSSTLFENIYRYSVLKNGKEQLYTNIADAFRYADKVSGIVYDNQNNRNIYECSSFKGSYIISGVPFISQYPELFRGCEVTSLCMLLNYKGIQTDKMTLASQITKDNTPYRKNNEIIIYGNPNTGFVGDIYSPDKKGYGVYHNPIFNLLNNYVPQYALDITGAEPRHIYYYIDRNCPVWVIVNSKFAPLPKENFEKWYTPEGEILITYNEHSVLVTGYDNEYVYFNDPMHPDGTQKALRSDFEAAWKQMGSQAVTIY